ncbi:MAG: hypothetical protein ACTSVZ_05730 [Promethearchaeota archaeon]
MENNTKKALCAWNIRESLGIILVQAAMTVEFDSQSLNSKVMQNTHYLVWEIRG